MRQVEWKDEALGLLKRLIVLLLVLITFFVVIFGIKRVDNNQMSPRFFYGDCVFYYRLENQYQAGDVVVYRINQQEYLGRVIARGGDSVDISPDGQVVLNGNPMIETAIAEKTMMVLDSDVVYPVNLADDEVFILADYREVGRDSRLFGAIQKTDIQGKALTALRRSSL